VFVKNDACAWRDDDHGGRGSERGEDGYTLLSRIKYIWGSFTMS
jgi:hypothetical protein